METQDCSSKMSSCFLEQETLCANFHGIWQICDEKNQYVQTFMDFDKFVMKKTQYVQTFMDFDTFVMKKTNGIMLFVNDEMDVWYGLCRKEKVIV